MVSHSSTSREVYTNEGRKFHRCYTCTVSSIPKRMGTTQIYADECIKTNLPDRRQSTRELPNYSYNLSSHLPSLTGDHNLRQGHYIMVTSSNQTAVTIVNVNQKTPRRYQTTRKRATYKPYPNYDDLMTQCDCVDAMPNDGNPNQPTHAAYTRLIEQAKIFTLWYATVFPTYYKKRRISREEVYVLIRYSSSSIYSLLQLLEQRVKQNREHHIPIDYPMAWCRKIVTNELETRMERELKEQRRLLDKKAELSHVLVTEVPNETKHLPEKAESKKGNKPPWDKREQQLPDDVWSKKYDDILATSPERLKSLSVVTLEPPTTDDYVLCRGDKDKDIGERASTRAFGGVPVELTPMELDARKRSQERINAQWEERQKQPDFYDRMMATANEGEAKERGNQEETVKQTTDVTPQTARNTVTSRWDSRILQEYIWKETYRDTTKDDGYQISETLKGMSVLTLTSEFLNGEPECVGDIWIDLKAYQQVKKESYSPVYV
jgi:hypothetical protein